MGGHPVGVHDGMNADGRAGLPPGAPPRPYFDTRTGYAPVNGPAAGVTALTRWAPLVQDALGFGFGTYTAQTVALAQTSLAAPLLVPRRRLRRLRLPPPYRSSHAYAPGFVCGTGAADPDGLCDAARAVVAAGAHLTPRRRTLIRWFDRPAASIADLAFRMLTDGGARLADYVVAELAINAFAWDATVQVWAEKLRHDAARPATLIPSILRHTPAGATFTPAVPPPPTPDYPSAVAAYCHGIAHILRALGGGALNLTIPLAAGQVGDGLPAVAGAISFDNLESLATACGESRVWGGLAFPAAVDADRTLGLAVAKEVLRTVACRAPGTPGLPPCEPGGGGGGSP